MERTFYQIAERYGKAPAPTDGSTTVVIPRPYGTGTDTFKTTKQMEMNVRGYTRIQHAQSVPSCGWPQ